MHGATIRLIISDFVISNGRRVVNVAFLLVGDSPASHFYVPTFLNNLNVPSL